MTGKIFHIQRFSIHDGPGIRTTVFLKGCPLSCFWCHNPEGISVSSELLYNPDKCIGCGACLQCCPNGVHLMETDQHILQRQNCTACGKCVQECFSGALEIAGLTLSVEEVMREVLRDQAYYSRGGGVTLSGGEPLMQAAFSRAILQSCKEHAIHTAVETCGDVPWRQIETILPYTDLILMDLKLLDSDRHRAAVGRPNERILQNARLLAQQELPIEFRTPVIPTVNDGEELLALAGFVTELKQMRTRAGIAAELRWEWLAFHQLAGDKYKSLGRAYRAAALPLMPLSQLQELRKRVEREYFL